MNLSVLLYREYRLKVKAKSFYIFQIIQPTFYLLFIGLFFGYTFNIKIEYNGVHINYLTYLLPGIVALQAVNAMYSISANVFNEYRYGVYRSLILSRVSPISYVSSKIIVETILSIVYACSLIVGYHVMYFNSVFNNLIGGFLISLPLISLSAIFWSLIGCIIGFTLENEEKRSIIFTLLNMPLTFISTVFYTSENLWIKNLTLLNPLTYSANLIREAILTGSISFNNLLPLTILTIVAALTLRMLIRNRSLVKR